jgi:hypothetical protein
MEGASTEEDLLMSEIEDLPVVIRGGMEGTSTEEGLLMREIEDLPVVISLSFIHMIGRDKVVYRDNPNIPQCETVCVSFWYESSRITVATASL